MNILVVGHNFPWPANNGGLVRLSGIVQVLAEMGDLDLVALCEKDRTGRAIPSDVSPTRVLVVPIERVPSDLQSQLRWMVQRGIPMEMAYRRIDEAGLGQFRRWVLPRYDLVWFSYMQSFVWLGEPALGPTVVDFPDLESQKERRRVQLLSSSDTPRGLRMRAHRYLSLAHGWKNADDWARVERRIARRVDSIVLSSSDDCSQSGLSNAAVVPNVVPQPPTPLGRPRPAGPPQIMFQGSPLYPPNLDAVRWLHASVAPAIRSLIPTAQIRVVGQPTPAVERMQDPPIFTVVGRVETMDTELARADLVIVPMRFGGGSRIKIIEAFAHRIPVVSTALGAEGLDVEDGVHLLIADEPEGLAAACRRILSDHGLREQIVAAAHRRYLERYGLDAARAAIAEVASTLD